MLHKYLLIRPCTLGIFGMFTSNRESNSRIFATKMQSNIANLTSHNIKKKTPPTFFSIHPKVI
ncbi:hypothetical protein Hanom_Chr09g00832721 [Helianthus anomalus]